MRCHNFLLKERLESRSHGIYVPADMPSRPVEGHGVAVVGSLSIAARRDRTGGEDALR